ncbi:MAG: hypothetical protein AB7I42_24255 [Bradyrhizobium sp.]|uniref:hypothetical protein n=1 Tax=Bradyrhizobium sp. TaxID=376 RepID=UPI003D0FD8BF
MSRLLTVNPDPEDLALTPTADYVLAVNAISGALEWKSPTSVGPATSEGVVLKTADESY